MNQVMRCVVCGHELSVADWEALPDDVCCPECGVAKSDYELVTLQRKNNTLKPRKRGFFTGLPKG